MSLINDALRKARQAAADHEEQRDRSLPPRAYPQRSGRRGVSPAIVAVVAVAAGVGGAAAVWWATTTPEKAPATTAVAAPAETGRGDTAVSGAGLLADRQATTPIVEAAPRPPTPAPAVPGVSAHSTTAQPGQPPSGDRAATENEPVEAVTVSGHEGQTPAPSQAKRGPTGERIFILDADLGTTSLSLGYIVFRPVRPFAEINGVEVYEGSEVEGFTVEKIEADKVTLRDADGPLVLRVP